VSEAGLIAARIVSYAAMLLATGIPLYRLSAGRNLTDDRDARIPVCLTALVAIAASLWWAMESIASMVAIPLSQLDGETIRAVLDVTPLGNVLAIRAAAFCVAAVAGWRRRHRSAAIAASVALATSAWTGHAGASEGALGHLHRAADVMHLLAAAIWIGALVLFLAALAGSRQDRDALIRRLSGFACTGSMIVLLLLVTGVINMLMIADWPPDWTNTWSALLLAKLAMFVAMLGLAACNRWKLTPALARNDVASRRALLISLSIETSLGFAIVAIVAALGTLSAAASS
jgi:putative copper resistance protein D